MPQGKFSKQESAYALRGIQLSLLRREAEEAAEKRGHVLKGWHYHSQGNSAATECKHCQAYVYVNTEAPAKESWQATGPGIGGTALLTDCT
jgi:hypothetical protein